MKAPTRAVIVEDIDSWAFNLKRVVRRAGASEVETCKNLDELHAELRRARFDIAIIDIGLDPNDNADASGVQALEMIRATDGASTRCVLVTGWQGGDRMSMQADLAARFRVEWAFMKEKFDPDTATEKLSELLDGAPQRRISGRTPMANLAAAAEPMQFEASVLRTLAPTGGAVTLYALAETLLEPVVPLVAADPTAPLRALDERPDGVPSLIGQYWSRARSAAVAVEFTTPPAELADHDALKLALTQAFTLPALPELLFEANRRNLLGRIWEFPGVGREFFPD